MTTTYIYALCEPGTRTIRYIGKSDNPTKRFRQHLEKSRRKKNHLGYWLARTENPELLILKSVPSCDWQWWEKSYIQNAKMLGFDLVNGTPGGDGVGSGIHHPYFGKTRPEETKRKIGIAHKGREFTSETRQRMSDAKSGRKLSTSTKRKMSLAGAGKKFPGSSSAFIGVAWDEFCSLWKASISISKHTFYLGRYDTETAAAQAYDWVATLFGRPLNFPE